ncbi:MAG: hypothetical protein GXX78_09275 [Bacteroidales bacterium]|nr:hypothetical protein [Bacteroidales bacterium]
MTEEMPVVIECPSCGERYLIWAAMSELPQGTTYYSDGYFTSDNKWRTPEIIGCVTCELGFTPQSGKIIATPNREEFLQHWSHLKPAQPPTTGALVLELRARKNMDTTMEKVLRKELWYSTSHTTAGKNLLENNAKFRNFWNDSMVQLEALFDRNNPAELLLKAEANRQLGHYEQCLELLLGEQSNMAEAIRNAAQRENCTLLVVAGKK